MILFLSVHTSDLNQWACSHWGKKFGFLYWTSYERYELLCVQCKECENERIYLNSNGPIIEGEEDRKSMATSLKTTGISRFAPNISKMLFIVIEMASPRGFLDFNLGAEKFAKKLSKNGPFFTLRFLSFFCQYLGLKTKIRNCYGDAIFIPQGHILKLFEGMSEFPRDLYLGCHWLRPSSPSIMGPPVRDLSIALLGLINTWNIFIHSTILQ